MAPEETVRIDEIALVCQGISPRDVEGGARTLDHLVLTTLCNNAVILAGKETGLVGATITPVQNGGLHLNVPELDVSKLHALPSEQQDLFILTFVSDFRQCVKALSPDTLPSQQATIKKEAIKIVGLGAPIPSRIIRSNVANTLADAFGRGSRTLLYETINDLLAILNAGKIDKDSGSKHMAVCCLGELFAYAGDSAVSLSGLVAQSLLKAFKASHVGLRASVLHALSRLVEGLGSSIDEYVARDILKASRSAATSDKSALVQKSAFRCIRILVSNTPYFGNSSDFDNLKSTAWKVLDSSVPAVRQSVAKTLAVILVRLFSENSSADVPVIKKPKKSNKRPGTLPDDDEEHERPGSPAPSGAKSSVLLTLNLSEILRTLSSQFIRAGTTNKARAGIGLCYKLVLRQLPQKVVEDSFGRICEQLFVELVDHPSLLYNRHRFLLTRNIVARLIQSILQSGILTENAQINAARYLINDVLKNYPKVVAERREPSKRVLPSTLETLNLLMERLGSAVTVLQDSCREALCQVMQHPSYKVQTHAALCFRTFVLACPAQLVPCMELMLARLKKSLDPGNENKQNIRTSTGSALSIAAMLHSANRKPVFGSLSIYSTLFSYSTDLLKASGTSELRVSATQVQVAWTLIGGLMNLGQSFVKVHLNQLLLLWRNAMPPPLTQENAAQRNQLELSFLCHVRECAMSGLLTFLTTCNAVVTTDGSRRISAMLQNTLHFLNNLPAARHTENMAHRLVPAMQLQDMTFLLRRRLLQCYAALVGLRHVDMTEALSHSDLVGLTMSTFIFPDRPADKSLEASLASSASNFEGLSEVGDNWAFGVSSLLRGLDVSYPSAQSFTSVKGPLVCAEETGMTFDEIANMPALPAREHDPTTMYRLDSLNDLAELSAASTACVDAAIKLFAVAFPLQSARVQESTIEQLATTLSQPLQREPGRKAALQVNAVLSLLLTLAVANDETSFSAGRIHFQQLGKTLTDILKMILGDPDPGIRSAAARALGLACNLGGTPFTNTEVKALIDNIVANRDPNMRAGCALALGSIHSEVGAMASSLHIKNIVGVLLSLCSDTHPIVHFWAFKGLTQVAESAGLSFSAYAASTLGMLAQLYSSDSHNCESSSLANSNLELEYSTTLAVAQSVDCIINVLGPDLQDIAKLRNLILTLVGYFKAETSTILRYESFVCLGHLAMYAPAHLQFSNYIQDLQALLQSNYELLSTIAVSGISDQSKRNALEVVRVARSTLSDDLWLKVDQDPSNEMLQGIMRNWMQQTVMTDPADWVDRCQTILSRTRVKEQAKLRPATAKTALPDLADEDVAGLTAAVATTQGDTAEAPVEGQDYLRWQTRAFAMQLLSEALELIQDAMLPDQAIPAEEQLHAKIADIIRVAFSASTANVVELRIWGLRIIDQILRMFGKTPDPDFLEASLLEQYQAQIGSALTPAFSADSSPDLAAEAIAVCATFVATGIVTSADRMGRIFKVLANGVDNLALGQPEAAIGDLKNLSPNAQAMLKMSLLSGWAQLQLASVEQSYLEDIVQPFVPKLAPLWLSALQEFASLRFEPEISDSLGPDTMASNLDDRYASFNRVVRLQFYQDTWLNIVDAISVLVEKDSDAVFDALDGKGKKAATQINGDPKPGKDMSFREEPVAFFFILFGLAFEALVTRARENPSLGLSILQALKKILTPAVSGNAVYDDAVFNETTDTLDRLALTSTFATQSVLIDIARNLSLDHPSAKSHHQERDEKLSDDIEQLFELTRIIILVLTGMIPTLEDPPGTAMRLLAPEAISLVSLSFQALVDVADVFPAIIKADLHACVFHCYCTILATGICQEEVLPSILPVFRTFLQSATLAGKSGTGGSTTTSKLVRGALHQMLTILSIAQRRENEYAITCAKNTLLSITVLLTSASAVIQPNDELVVKAVEEILDCLQDVGLAKVAANCVRTLLLGGGGKAGKTRCDEMVGRLLWPRIVAFVCDEDVEDGEGVRPSLVAALVGGVATVGGGSGRQAAMAVVVPMLLYRATRSGNTGANGEGALRRECAGKLLELAAMDQGAFRSTVAALDEEGRAVLEELLRGVGGGGSGQGVGGGRGGGDEMRKGSVGGDGDGKPRIELRMDF